MKQKRMSVLLLLLLSGCAGYVPGRQLYWDTHIREMCTKDGGTTVYETVELTEEEYKKLGGIQAGLPLPSASRKDSTYPYYYEMFETRIREMNPAVVRLETLVIRRADGKLLGRSIAYLRRGGDFPTGLAADSSFLCPENDRMTSEIFRLKDASK